MGVLDVDILKDLGLHDPVAESWEVQEAADGNIVALNLLFAVTSPVLDLYKDVFELGHSSDLFVKKWAHEELLRDLEFVHF